ncbi:hypothetical protein T07_6095 [Trichinella nelsoni]|uniref:Uncharacterized protein n=1 Tax=Trichinella nelsoni TaxID=6336 RepID=A0A0V0RBL9_9BILA|nr:hypothetical protein T07_6095 [Trichinella nelsoni]
MKYKDNQMSSGMPLKYTQGVDPCMMSCRNDLFIDPMRHSMQLSLKYAGSSFRSIQCHLDVARIHTFRFSS